LGMGAQVVNKKVSGTQSKASRLANPISIRVCFCGSALIFVFSISFYLRRESSAVKGVHATSIAQKGSLDKFDSRRGS